MKLRTLLFCLLTLTLTPQVVLAQELHIQVVAQCVNGVQLPKDKVDAQISVIDENNETVAEFWLKDKNLTALLKNDQLYLSKKNSSENILLGNLIPSAELEWYRKQCPRLEQIPNHDRRFWLTYKIDLGPGISINYDLTLASKCKKNGYFDRQTSGTNYSRVQTTKVTIEGFKLDLSFTEKYKRPYMTKEECLRDRP